jgi:hypothetical protein
LHCLQPALTGWCGWQLLINISNMYAPANSMTFRRHCRLWLR